MSSHIQISKRFSHGHYTQLQNENRVYWEDVSGVENNLLCLRGAHKNGTDTFCGSEFPITEAFKLRLDKRLVRRVTGKTATLHRHCIRKNTDHRSPSNAKILTVLCEIQATKRKHAFLL